VASTMEAFFHFTIDCGSSACPDYDVYSTCSNIDNDCFGGDEACPTCGLPGEPCSSGADCCSLRCHPRRLTCK
jgi:hypothetical protein